MNEKPYSDIDDADRLQLQKDVFSIIKKSKAKLFSVTIDLIQHYKQDDTPFNPMAFGLIYLVESIIHYMKDRNVTSIDVKYERYSKTIRNRIDEEYKKMQKMNFETNLKLNILAKNIGNGESCKRTNFTICRFLGISSIH